MDIIEKSFDGDIKSVRIINTIQFKFPRYLYSFNLRNNPTILIDVEVSGKDNQSTF